MGGPFTHFLQSLDLNKFQRKLAELHKTKSDNLMNLETLG